MRSFLLTTILVSFLSHVYGNCISGDCNTGFGISLTTNGDKYIGHFEDGKFNGIGAIEFTNQNKYFGSWENGKFNGYGTYYLNDKPTQKGYWQNGKFIESAGSGCITGNCDDGYGTMVFENDIRYIGSFNNKNTSTGIYFFPDGSKFIGKMEKGQKHGRGILFNIDGSLVSGVWNLGSFIGIAKSGQGCVTGNCNNGNGTFVYPDNSQYIGSFKHTLAHGIGACLYSDGDYYEGEWKNHTFNGFGTLILSDGRQYAGFWEEGEFIGNKPKLTPLIDSETKTTPALVQPTVKALIVGVSKYNHMRSLRYTDDDAYKMYAFLKSPEGGAVRDENIKVLIDESATRDNILDNIDELFMNADENDIVLFYFSGHGLKGSFIPSDYDGENGKLYHNEIIARLNRSNAKGKIIIADACHSGSLEQELGTKSADFDDGLKKYYQAFHQSEGGTALLLSSKAEENSIEFNGLRQGIFSHFLLKGLKGEADEDKNQIITIFELYKYINFEVTDYTENIQTPILIGDFDRNMPLGMIRKIR